MRTSRVPGWALAVLLLVPAAACSDTGSPTTTDGSSATAEASSPAPEADVDRGVPAPPNAVPTAIPPSKSSQGANAAPGEQFYDSSQKAFEDFWSWWRYEAVLPQDWSRNSQTVYEDGIIVCASRARGAGEVAITDTLVKHRGYQPAGAAAVYAAAVRALCKHQNTGTVTDNEMGGYTTHFDRTVAQARAQILLKAPFIPGEIQPKVVDFGWFAKYACFHLGHSGTNGLMEYLIANSTMYEQGGRVYLADPRYHTERDREIYVIETWTAVCYGPTVFNEDWYR